MRPSADRLLGKPAGLPMTPLIDVVLLLLIFFMLISRYLPPSLNVALPEASSATVDDRPSIAISIDSEGALMVDGNMEEWEALPGLLEGRDPETQIRIAADRTADYAFVVRALDAAGNAGLPNVALEADPQGSAVLDESAGTAETMLETPTE